MPDRYTVEPEPQRTLPSAHAAQWAADRSGWLVTCCHECQLPLHEGEPVREVVDEEHGELVRHPVHADCRLALAREYAGLVRGLMVELMRRRAEKTLGERRERAQGHGNVSQASSFCEKDGMPLSPAEAPEEPALLSTLRVAS